MKKPLLLITAALLCLTASFAPAQPQMGPPTAGVNAAMAKLFGKTTAFSANAEIAISGKGNDATMMSTMALLDGKTRMEMDMGTMKSKQMPPDAAQSLKTMGMDKMVVISLPKDKKSLLIYPGLQGYTEMPIDKAEAEAAEKNYKIAMTAIGEETIDGRKTIKNKVTITDEQNKTYEYLTWNAPDLKDFPVRFQVDDRGTKIVMTYRDIKLEKPAASLFEAPGGFTKHSNLMALMQAGAMRMMKQ